ncbi:MAG: aspartate aminotransferase [Chloroflexi bacterium RBG_16_54_18]|nr:MAG: aspartate aminotransferase [Chloroflexi bacterium RBG_16_54_18]
MEFSERVQNLTPEGAYAVLAKAQELEARGRRIIHLEIGQPDEPTFPNIVAAGVRAIHDGYTRYTPSAGLPALRRAIADDAGRRRGVEFSPSQVVVGPGAKPALFFPTLALVRPKSEDHPYQDEVLYPDPGFPTYRAMIEVAGGLPVPVPLREDQDFAFDLEAFDRLVNERTRMVILNSPANPTGGVLPLEALEHIAKTAQKFDFWVLSDEIYSRLVYASSACSIITLPGMAERTILCDGFSKTYAMTGWRLGFGLMPESLAERVDLLLTHSVGCTAGFTQMAGLEALLGPQEQAQAVVAEYRRRRDTLVAGLNAIRGVSCRMPSGAFYAFPNISSLSPSSDWLADYLLTEAGVAVLPGTAFGRYGEGYLRLCFANSLENIQQALAEISKSLRNI